GVDHFVVRHPSEPVQPQAAADHTLGEIEQVSALLRGHSNALKLLSTQASQSLRRDPFRIDEIYKPGPNGTSRVAGDLLGENRKHKRLETISTKLHPKRSGLANQIPHHRIGGAEMPDSLVDLRRVQRHGGHRV